MALSRNRCRGERREKKRGKVEEAEEQRETGRNRGKKVEAEERREKGEIEGGNGGRREKGEIEGRKWRQKREERREK